MANGSEYFTYNNIQLNYKRLGTLAAGLWGNHILRLIAHNHNFLESKMFWPSSEIEPTTSVPAFWPLHYYNQSIGLFNKNNLILSAYVFL